MKLLGRLFGMSVLLGSAAAALILCSSMPELAAQDKVKAKDAVDAPKTIFRSFSLPATEPQISQKMIEYANEGWELVTPLAAQTASAAQSTPATQSGVFKRPYHKKQMAKDGKLEGTWQLCSSNVYGTASWPVPASCDVLPEPADVTKKPPIPMITFLDGGFSCTSNDEKKGVAQQGSVQYVKELASGWVAIDLLIESGKDTANQWFTVRSILKVDEDNLCLISGGFGSDRPAPPADPTKPSNAPAYSNYSRVNNGKASCPPPQ